MSCSNHNQFPRWWWVQIVFTLLLLIRFLHTNRGEIKEPIVWSLMDNILSVNHSPHQRWTQIGFILSYKKISNFLQWFYLFPGASCEICFGNVEHLIVFSYKSTNVENASVSNYWIYKLTSAVHIPCPIIITWSPVSASQTSSGFIYFYNEAIQILSLLDLIECPCKA